MKRRPWTLSDELEQLEIDDPAVAEAARKYDAAFVRMRSELIGKLAMFCATEWNRAVQVIGHLHVRTSQPPYLEVRSERDMRWTPIRDGVELPRCTNVVDAVRAAKEGGDAETK